MPVIFSQAVLRIPIFIASLLATRFVIFRWFSESMARGGAMYNVFDFILIVFFAYFYTALVFNPEELAENIKKGGGFIPGIRPGKKTAEFFDFLLKRIVLVGAIYLAFLAILPNLILGTFSSNITISSLMSGTSLLIMVGVALEVGAQLESYLIEHRYEGFLASGRMRGRGGR
jgi:preprotein translocase subunit SecY